jgi:hypothetical protein
MHRSGRHMDVDVRSGKQPSPIEIGHTTTAPSVPVGAVSSNDYTDSPLGITSGAFTEGLHTGILCSDVYVVRSKVFSHSTPC